MRERRDEVVADRPGQELVAGGEALEDVLRVAAEDLVAALAREHHLHAARGFFREHVDRDVGGLRDGRIAVGDELGQVRDDVVELHRELVVRRAEVARHHVRVRELAVAAFAEAHREGLHVAVVARHERHDARGVEAAGEEGAERHVAHHLQLHRLVEPREERIDRARARERLRPGTCPRVPLSGVAIGSAPVAPLGEPAVLPCRARRRWKLADRGEERARPGHVAVSEEIPYRREVHGGLRARHFEQRLDLGGEVDAVRVLVQEERLLAEAVAGEEEPVARRVPDREGEHAAQVAHDLVAPMLVAAQQHLGVGVEREAVAAGVELLTQLAEIVDLAIEREREPGSLVHHRLASALGIDDREPPVAEQHAPAVGRGVFGDATAIGAAMRDALEHARDDLPGHPRSGECDGAGDPAHGASPSPSASRAPSGSSACASA